MADKEARDTPLRSQDPFAELVHGVLDSALFLLDPAGHVVSWNRGAERLAGYRAEEIAGKHFSVLYPPDAVTRRWPEQELRQAQERGRFEDEGWRVRKDGAPFWAAAAIWAMRDGQGRLQGFCGSLRELSERRRQEEALRRSEERFALLANAVKEYALVMLDRDGRVASWNGGAERVTGYKADEALGRHFSMFSPQEAVAKKWPEQELAMAREQGRYEDEGLRVRKDGAAFWAHVQVTPLYDPQGVLLGYALVTRDLTDRRRVDDLEKAERQTNEFLAMLAHELRNPLAPISNALQLLARGPAAGTGQWALEVLQRQTAQLQRLVDDLLDVSRITREKITLERKRIDLRVPVRAALQAARQWIEPREQVLSVELPEEPVPVLGDQARLAQVVQNLLHNAAKYTPERGRIALSLRREGAELRLAVRDSGIGMDPATLSTAFELFRQGPQGLQRAQGGLGVGLTLVQRLVHLHGGSVQGHSAGADQGSEFVIRLPAADAPARAAPEPAPLPERTPARRVLIVDDNQDAANALMLLLQNEGHEVKVANDGVSGLALAREYKPDYLLLDIGLPRLSGYDIASTLRADPALRGTIIVAVTGYGQVHDRARTAAMGFDHHLTKPVEFSALQDLFRGKPL